MKKYDVVIVGRGFKAMMTAYACLKKNKKVLVLSEKNNFYGIMGSFKWKETKLDFGYQFFDGLNEETKKILNEFIGNENLFDFGYGAGSYTNGKLNKGFAIPYWPNMGFMFIFFSITSLFFNFIKYLLKLDNGKINTLKDLHKNSPSNIKKIINKASIRNFNIESDQLSSLAEDYAPITHYRLKLLPDFISIILKKNSKFFDNKIAASRKALKLETISLYPKNKNMEYIAKIMHKKLITKGAVFESINDLQFKFDKKLDLFNIINNKKNYNTNYIYFLNNIDDLYNFLSIKNFISSNHFVSQVFYIFSYEKVYSELQYVHANDINLLVNRVSNVSLYSHKLKNNEAIIFAEVPCKINSDIWNNPEDYKFKVWKEVQLMKIADSEKNFNDLKIVKLNQTFPVPKVKFKENLSKINSIIKTNFGNKIKTPGIDIIGRHDFIVKLMNDDYIELKSNEK